MTDDDSPRDIFEEAEHRLGQFRQEVRDREIVAAHADGIPVQVIAWAVGMTRQGVYKILRAAERAEALDQLDAAKTND